MDERTDVYSFGVLLHEMMPNPGPWGRVIQKCLADSREARYGTMREVLQELEQRRTKWRWAAIVAAGLLLAGLAGWQLMPFGGEAKVARNAVERLASFDDGEVALFPAISPNGEQVAYSAGGRVYVQKRGEANG